MEFLHVIEDIGALIDFAGVLVILIGIVLVSGYFVYNLLQRTALTKAAEQYRRGIGRTLLLGLEFLVAADIIHTVAVAPTLENVAVLGLIVLVRTFLSWSLDLELTGRWPWQRSTRPSESQEEL